MCRIPKIVIVAPEDMHADLRRKLSSLEYDVTATIATSADASEISADVAIVWEPTVDDIFQLKDYGLKTVAVGSDDQGADMHLLPDDIAAFKTRVWELFRPA
jgi:2-keto-3-deoxy-L-rhamnonate aldolase RhmA